MKQITALLYHDFTALDALGPLEVLGRLPGYEIRYASLFGGMGSRQLVLQDDFLAALRKAALESTLVMTVCTGSALAAAAGLLDGLHATGNKKAFDWTMSMGKKVLWQRDARWTRDGKFYTDAGVSAGIDMALGFVADHFGREKAFSIAEGMEYGWNERAEGGWCFKKQGK